MNSIRLWPMGSKKQRSYRIVVADSRAPIQGKYIEAIGLYEPQSQPSRVRVDEDRARYWLSVGAKPSTTVTNILMKAGVLDENGKMIVVEGTYSDPLVTSFLQLLKRLEHNLRLSDQERLEFASRLALETRKWQFKDE